MRKSLSSSLVFLLGLQCSFVSAMIVDSRFIPLLQKPFFSVQGCPSHVSASLFAAMASESLLQNDEYTGLPEIYGVVDTSNGMRKHASLDVNVLGQACEAVGLANPLGELKGLSLPYRQEGKMQAQGGLFAYHQAIGDYVSLGGSVLFMRFLSTQRFYLDTASVNVSQQALDFVDVVDKARRDMFNELGFKAPASDQSGVGDFNFYLRIGKTWDYTLKCKSLSYGTKFGVLAPAGRSRETLSPASVPFGGNGHWGMYTAMDFEAEVKEYWKVGLMAWVGKRFARVTPQRLSVGGEPMIFGVMGGKVKVNPGFTGSVSPYVTLENIRSGLGMRVQYTLTKHAHDQWKVLCKDNDVEIYSLMSHCKRYSLGEYVSRWASDYITLDAFYDFGSARAERSFDPILFVSCDIPVDAIVANAVPRMYKISLGLDISF
jgi:hypothetical protein